MTSITVLMPVYNARRFLTESVTSILDQEFGDFEFIIFDDGSTDGSKEVIKSFRDPRIKFIDSNVNTGYVPLLNAGLKIAKGKYIARMDADDISHPARFRKQFEFLERNNDHVLCGTRYTLIGDTTVASLPIESDDIKLKMLYITPFCHPTIMMRTSVVQEYDIQYDQRNAPAEDHELWTRLAQIGKLANLPEVLLQYRLHDSNISLKLRTAHEEERLRNARERYIDFFFKRVLLDMASRNVLYDLFFTESAYTYEALLATGRVLDQIVASNGSYPVPTKNVHALLTQKFLYKCTTSTGIGMKAFAVANKFKFAKASVHYNFKLFMKALLRYKSS